MQSLNDGQRAGVMLQFRSMVYVLQWLVIGLGLVSLPMPVLIEIENAETKADFVDINLPDDPPHYLTITTVQPDLKHVVYRSLLVLIVSGMILTFVAVTCRAGTVLSCFACILISVALVMSCCAGAFYNLAPWQYGPPIQGPDGQTYYVMESGFLQDQTLVLARLAFCK